MTFLWPEALVLVLAAPVFVVCYARLERRSRPAMARPSLPPTAAATAASSTRLRHLPIALFVVSLALLGIAAARPQALVTGLSPTGTAVIAIDVSTSMLADDIAPNRIARAKALAKEFVDRYADRLRIGLVSFGANTTRALDPTSRREDLHAAIDQLGIERGTAVGSAIATALNMLVPGAAPEGERPAASDPDPSPAKDDPARSIQRRSGPSRTPNTGAMIVLLTDGQSGAGLDPEQYARRAAAAGVRIHTIGVGTHEGAQMRLEGWSMHVRLDEATLTTIATLTGGHYFPASAVDWPRLQDSIGPEWQADRTYIEITALFAAAAAAAAIASALMSLFQAKRVI